jgi:L-ascorbate metabolism protein UlaG (beta-lactamase superfamily)
MKITRFGHSCVLVEDGNGRVLLDPGMFSSGFDDLRGLTGILITHQHPDHLDVERVTRLLEANPEATLVTDEGSQLDVPHTVARAGDTFDLGLTVSVHGSQHAVIHPDLPQVPNVGYLVGDRFFTPGDALTVPDADVEVLGVPTDAPWLKLVEAVQLLRDIAPAKAFPVHDGVLDQRATGIWFGHFDRLSPEATSFSPLAAGDSMQAG